MKTLSYGIIYKGKTRFTYQAMRGADKSATLEVMGLLVSYWPTAMGVISADASTEAESKEINKHNWPITGGN